MIDLNDIDGSAAEYVLGTLTAEERMQATTMRATNREFATAIEAWDKRLAPLNESTSEVMLPTDLYVAIERRLFGPPTRPAMTLRHWRRLALAASVAMVVVLGLALYGAPSRVTPPHYVAVLQTDKAAPGFLVGLNEKTLTLTVQAITAPAAADKSYELWYIAEGGQAPHSLGILPQQDVKTISLANLDPVLLRNATLAVSLEPRGGSPTGAPTGPVLFTGKFVQSAL